MNIKQLLKRVLGHYGYRISKSIGGGVSDPFGEQKRLIGDAKAPVIFDVGAHTGETTLTYRSYFSGARIYSFEPFQVSFDRLRLTVASDPLTHPYNLALGVRSGQSTLFVNRSHATNSLLQSHSEARSAWNQSDAVETVSVEKVTVSTLDEFVEQHDIRAIDILKIDAQGSEHDIIEGAHSLLARRLVRLVYCEILTMPTYNGQKEVDEFLKLMRQKGLVLWNLYNMSYADTGRMNQMDALFVQSEHAS